MKKEPIFLYFIRFFCSLLFLGLIGMLYWSSLVIEDRLQIIQSDLAQLRSETDKIRIDMTKAPLDRTLKDVNKDLFEQKVADSDSENLLKKDPFEIKTLPLMLGTDFKPSGIRRNATIGKPDHLHPFNNWKDISDWYELCGGSVAKLAVGQYEVMAPNFAERMELRKDERGDPEYWVFLRKDLFWKPLKQRFFGTDLKLAPWFLQKHPVTAHDFKFFFDALSNPHVSESGAVALRTLYQDIKDIVVVDDLTFKVKWRTGADKKMKYKSKTLTGSLQPLPVFVYQYFADGSKILQKEDEPNAYRTNPIWAQNFSHHWAKNIIVSCGAWEFDGMTEQEIRFIRNTDYFNPYAALSEKTEIKFKNSVDAIWEEFKQGSLDGLTIQPQQLSELSRFMQSTPYKSQEKKGLGIQSLNFVARQLWYIGMNETRPFFKSHRVRQAITMAIDRDRLIRQILNGMGIPTTGTFFPYSSSYDKEIVPYPYNPQKALELLHEDGWSDSTGDGILDKVIDGQRISFVFTLTYFVKDPTAKAMCESISTALKDIGILCKLNGVDVADLSALFEDKNFDAYYMAWALGTPPDDPRQLWYSSGAKEKGSSNAIGFANPEIDAIIDQLDYEYNEQERIKLYHRFDRILHEQAPYVFLFVPKITYVYRNYLQNVFIPAERQDLIPGADVVEPISNIFWINYQGIDDDQKSLMGF